MTKPIRKMPEDCPIHVGHESLKLYSEETRLMAEQNRTLIENNHTETMKLINEASKTNSDGLSILHSAMEDSNKKFDTLNETVQRAGRVFGWWDSLPKKIRSVSKVVSVIVAAMGGITVIITFLKR